MRGVRLLVVLTLINTTLLGMSVLGPQLFPFVTQQYAKWKASRAEAKALLAGLALQQQAAAHVAPADRVVYEEDPAEAARLLKQRPLDYKPSGFVTGSVPPGWVAPVQATAPPYFASYVDAVHGGTRVHGVDNPLLFLHERKTPGGVAYVVAVQLSANHTFNRNSLVDVSGATTATRYRQTKHRSLTAAARIADPAGPAAAVKARRHSAGAQLNLPDSAERQVSSIPPGLSIDVTPEIDYGNALRFFAGQPDPNDASHFTIAYQADGRDGVIDGWLKDNGLVLRPREAQWSFDNSGQAWRLLHGPATKPGTTPKLEAAPVSR